MGMNQVLQRRQVRDFPGGPVTKTPKIPMSRAWVRFLERELDPTYLQLKKKILYAAMKTEDPAWATKT